MAHQYTFVFLKPDALEKRIVGQIISRFEETDLKITFIKLKQLNYCQVKEHYAHVSKFPFFEEMIDFITSKRVLILIIEGENAVQKVRDMIGSTLNAPKGTIRGDFGAEGYRNLIHASDSQENAKTEIDRFFTDNQLCEEDYDR